VLLRLGGARAGGLLGTVVVVHRENDEAIRELAKEYRAHPVGIAQDAELSDSLRAGIAAIASRADGAEPTALLVCMGDQPLVRLDVIESLVAAWRSDGYQALRPVYRDAPGEPGHPLLLDRSLWGYAGDLRGEEGLAPVFARRGIPVKQVPVPGRNPDVDTPADLAALEAGPGGAA
jgi:molybdenum cofactor cytidylyltransferase